MLLAATIVALAGANSPWRDGYHAPRATEVGPSVGDWKLYALLSVAIWIAALQSGVHPTVAGVAIGLLTGADPLKRASLEEATDVTRRFRQRPSPALASEAARRPSLVAPSFFVNEVRYRGAYDLESPDTLVRRVLRIVEKRASAAAREAEEVAEG